MTTAPAPRRGGPRPGDSLIAGERLRAWRIERGLSQHEVAMLVGTTQGVISSWETARRSPIGLYAERLRAVLAGDLPFVS